MNRGHITCALLVLSFFFLITSCSKEAGEGGTSGIRGKVYAKYYDDYFTTFLGAAYAQDKEVFIVYGDDATYSDKVTTNYDGTYEFSYLRKGNYKVYVYSEDSTLTSPSGEIAVMAEIEISKNNVVVNVPDIMIFD